MDGPLYLHKIETECSFFSFIIAH